MKKIKTQNKPQKSKKKYFFQKTAKTKKTQYVEIRKTYMYLLFFVYSYMYLWIERKRTTIVKKQYLYTQITNDVLFTKAWVI